MAAPMFSIWLGGDQLGGNMCFPEFGFRHDDVRAGNTRLATWCADVPHATAVRQRKLAMVELAFLSLCQIKLCARRGAARGGNSVHRNHRRHRLPLP